MSDNVYVNAERTAVVEATSPGKKWQMPRKEAQRLGLLPDGEAEPQARRVVRDTTNAISAPRDDTQRVIASDTKKRTAPK